MRAPAKRHQHPHTFYTSPDGFRVSYILTISPYIIFYPVANTHPASITAKQDVLI